MLVGAIDMSLPKEALASESRAKPKGCGATNTVFDFLLPGAPNQLEPFLARTASQHIFYSHVTRGLLSQALDGGLEGNLAESWTVSDNHTRFEFRLKKAKWSDGSDITSADLKKTFEAGKHAGATTHFDFRDIKEVGAKGDDVFWITTKTSSPGFLRNLLVPETGVISEVSIKSRKIEAGQPTSGAYQISSWDGASVLLKANTYFEGSVPDSPTCLRLANTSKEVLSSGAHVDLAWMPSNMDIKSHEAVMARGQVEKMEPPIAFTYFIAMNPDSKSLANKDCRTFIQSLLSPAKFDPASFGPQYERAHQLYQHDGAGRPSKTWLDAFWKSVEDTGAAKSCAPKERIRLAFSRVNAFHVDIEKRLRDASLDIEPVAWANSGEYVKVASNPSSYDMILLNNDYSSVELLENLIVSFNPQRPYIKLAKGSPIHQMMTKAKAATAPSERYPLYEAVAKTLLEEARIVPLAYEHIFLYKAKNIDVSKLSVVSPDLRMWRVSVSK